MKPTDQRRNSRSRLNWTLPVLLLASMPSESAEREIIGQWRDNVGAWQTTITIVKEADHYFRETSFKDGSSNRAELVEIKAHPNEKHRFRDTESDFGEIYVIDAAGNLDLHDSDGFIREAKRIPSATRSSARGPCPAATLYAKSRVNIRSGAGLGESVVRKAARGELLRCHSSQGEWYRLETNRTAGEWVHSSVVSTSRPVALPKKKEESCHALGVRYGRCTALSMAGRRCDPADDIVKPKRCMGDSSFDRGILAGVSKVPKR